MFEKGDTVLVTFDLAEKCPFLEKAPMTIRGRVVEDLGGKTIKVYVAAHHPKVSYYGYVEVPREQVTQP